MEELEVSDRESFVQKGLIGVTDTAQLIVADRPDLLFQPFSAASRSASASITATASPPSARRTSSSTTHTNPSTSCCSSCARRSPTPTSWPSSGRSIARARPPDHPGPEGRGGGRASRSPPWSSSRPASTRRPTSNGRATWKVRACRWCMASSSSRPTPSSASSCGARAAISHLLPCRHRQLSPGDRQVYTDLSFFTTDAHDRPRCVAHLEFRHRLRRAGRA